MLGTLAHALLRAASTILSMHGSRRTKKYPHECGYGRLRTFATGRLCYKLDSTALDGMRAAEIGRREAALQQTAGLRLGRPRRAAQGRYLISRR